MIDDLLMLTCGWVGGVVATLLIHHSLVPAQVRRENYAMIDPALLPSSVPMPLAALPALPSPPSPYAPKARPALAAQPRVLRTHEKHKVETLPKSVANPLVGHGKYIIRDFRDFVV